MENLRNSSISSFENNQNRLTWSAKCPKDPSWFSCWGHKFLIHPDMHYRACKYIYIYIHSIMYRSKSPMKVVSAKTKSTNYNRMFAKNMFFIPALCYKTVHCRPCYGPYWWHCHPRVPSGGINLRFFNRAGDCHSRLKLPLWGKQEFQRVSLDDGVSTPEMMCFNEDTTWLKQNFYSNPSHKKKKKETAL